MVLGENYMNVRLRSFLHLMCIIAAMCITLVPSSLYALTDEDNDDTIQPLLKDIVVHGNKYVTIQAILNRLPYKKGDSFDVLESARAIRHLHALGYFKQIKLEREDTENDTMILHVTVSEKKLLEKITFSGNTVLNKKDFFDKLKLEKLVTIDQDQLHRLIKAIKRLYKDENYHQTEVKAKVIANVKNRDKVQIHFSIKEGQKALISHVSFTGNKNIPDRKLSGVIFTRENWILSFLNDAGKYDEEHFEMDKHRLEYFYRNHGYLLARVIDTDVKFSKNKKAIHVTFHIQEGPQFKVNSVRALGDELFSEEKRDIKE